MSTPMPSRNADLCRLAHAARIAVLRLNRTANAQSCRPADASSPVPRLETFTMAPTIVPVAVATPAPAAGVSPKSP